MCCRELPTSQGSNRKWMDFVMHFSDDEIEELDSEDEDNTRHQHVATGRRFACDELYISGFEDSNVVNKIDDRVELLSDNEDSENGKALGIQSHLMEPVGLVEGALF
ncbi:hypothetical protein LIER_24363 [Lithospermum erythrorhizon]|uniref:Uncharacterized protein n=1 Tax=Lithospermum erythrorhizon TaxID=34254 RepID=A0AAV3R439_LITER